MKKHASIFLLFSGLALPATAPAGLIFFVNDAPGFAAASAGLTFKGTEDWEESTLAGGSIATFNDPLAPGVANSSFPTGSNPAAGITAQSNTLGASAATLSPRGVFGLATASAGFNGTPSDQASPNTPGDSFDLLVNPSGGFSAAVSLRPLYFDLAATSATSHPGSVDIRVYDPAGILLGSQTVSGVDYSGGAFLGIAATAGSNIRRINLFATTNSGNSVAGADDIAVYGSVVPEPAGSTLLLTGLFACARLRGRRY